MMNQANPSALPATIVIFGASGDLTQRKLVPALFELHRKGRLPANMRIVGFARRPHGHDEFRGLLRSSVQQRAGTTFDATNWDTFARHLWYGRGDLATPGDHESLETFLRELEGGPSNRLYYLATPPSLYEPIVESLAAAGMAREVEGWRRIVVEKPFGLDLASARALNRTLHAAFEERQIFRIDHYLGKETAQNILFFRFGNTVFETVWNRNYIDHVQITVAEQVDVGHRGGFYDQTGVLRDMFQNHLMQLLALVTMEPPASFSPDAVRNEKAKVLASIRPITPDTVAEQTLRAQYHGYREAPGVAPDSTTATYAALRLYVENWRWQGVPFYLRSGKGMAAKSTQVNIQFRRPPHMMFPLTPGQDIAPDVLSLCLQPHEGAHFRFAAKVPDTGAEMRPVEMAFHYDDAFGPRSIPDAYERLLVDALSGDATLFIRSDVIELAWQLIDPIVQGWESITSPPLETYERGSWGPEAANELIARDGGVWFPCCTGYSM